MFKCYPKMNLANFQANLESNGQIDLSKHGEITFDEFDVFAKTILSLNRKKYPLKNLILDNCDLTDDKLEALAPLLVKFQHVTLNGSQKIQSFGYCKLGKAIREPGCKMTKLELKISKNDDATIRLRREILLEELKGMTLTAESLSQVSRQTDLRSGQNRSSQSLDLIRSQNRTFNELTKDWENGNNN